MTSGSNSAWRRRSPDIGDRRQSRRWGIYYSNRLFFVVFEGSESEKAAHLQKSEEERGMIRIKDFNDDFCRHRHSRTRFFPLCSAFLRKTKPNLISVARARPPSAQCPSVISLAKYAKSHFPLSPSSPPRNVTSSHDILRSLCVVIFAVNIILSVIS